MLKNKFFIALLVLMVVSLACQFQIGSDGSPEPPEETTQVDAGPQLTGTAQALELEQLKAQATADAESAAQAQMEVQETADAQAEIDAQNTAAAEEAEEQDTEEATVEDTPAEEIATEETEAQGTEEPEEPEPAETEETGDNADMTEIEQKMNDDLQLLYDQGVISEIKDEFTPFVDFQQEIAKIQYITWWATDYSPENFVIRADVNWDSASDIANWPDSGCGWVFGEKDENNYHLAYFGLDGNGYLIKTVNGDMSLVTKHYYGPVSVPQGEAELILAVQDKKATLYVNGEEVYSTFDANIKPGTLSFTVLSGTNKGFGTRCKMTDIGLMVLD